MNFASGSFLFIFLPVVIAGFAAISGPAAAAIRQRWLTVASFVFYGISGWSNLGMLAASILINYSAGWALAGPLRNQGWRRHSLLGAVVAANLALLFGCKWAAVATSTATGFLTDPAILIPLALSFLTFQQIGFVTDCYRGRIEPPHFSDYLFFVVFFPQLIMGPIVQYGQIIRQLQGGALARWSLENLAIGLSIVAVGLAKKILADKLGVPIDRAFAAAADGILLDAPTAWFASIGFQLQLYFDVSAYADMAIGLGRIFGIALPINFDSPLKAIDRFDVWRRWHITFVVFMRSHVFLPLVRHAKVPVVPALFFTAILSGLWHGLGWTFVVWGLVQAALMVATHFLHARRVRNQEDHTQAGVIFAIATTFLTSCVVSVLFRSPSLEAAGLMYLGMANLGVGIGLDGWSALLGLDLVTMRSWLTAGDLLKLGLAAVVVLALPDTPQFFARFWTALDSRPDPPRGARRRPAVMFSLTPIWAAAVGVIIVMAAVIIESRRFIYVQF